MVIRSQKVDPVEILDSQKSPEIASPTPVLDTQERLAEIKVEVLKGKNEAEREKILLDSLQHFLHPEEQALLLNLENLEKEPTEEMKDYLFSGAALLSAVCQAQTDRPGVSVRELVDHFESDPSVSIQSYRNALLFILNHPESSLARWFHSEAWNEAQVETQQLLVASSAVKEALDGVQGVKVPKDEKEKGFFDSVKETAGTYSDEIKVVAILGAIGLGMYAFSRWVKKKFGKESQTATTTSKVLKYGAYALGGAFIYGKVAGSDWVSERFSKNNDSFINSRWSKAAIAFSNFEFGNVTRYLFEGAPSVEQDKQYGAVADLFEVDASDLPGLARLNFVDFMEGQASTLMNFRPQRETDEKVRSRIKNYYYDRIREIPHYETLTVGQIFEIGLRQGLFTSVDVSDLAPADQATILAQREADVARLTATEAYFDAPGENMDGLHETAVGLLTDIKELTEFSETWWGDAASYFDHALWFNAFTDADDTHEYGDIKGIREYILMTTGNGLNKDKQVFAEMANQVQEFDGFLKQHPNPDQWTEADKSRFEVHKNEVMSMRKQIDGARRQVNEQRQRDLMEDHGEITVEDLEEGVVFTLHGLTGVKEVISFEAQQVYEGDVMAWTLLISQVSGAAYQVVKDRPETAWGLTKSTLSGFVKGPIQTFALGLDMMSARSAFQYNSGELLKRYFRGEISSTDLALRLQWAKKYAYLIERGPVGALGSTRLGRGLTQTLISRLEGLLVLGEQMGLLKAWEDHFVNGATLADGSDELTFLKHHLNEAEMEEIRAFYSAGGPATLAKQRAADASSRIRFEKLANSKVVIRVDGHVVNLAQNEREGFAIADRMIAQAEKGGNKLDRLKLRHLWKFASPLVEIAGTAFTIQLLYKIQEASDNPEELQKIVAEETANIIAFLVGSKLTLAMLLQLKKPNTPGLAAVYAILSLMGGIATALKINEPIVSMVEGLVSKYPNGYEVASEAAAVLGTSSVLASVRMNAGLLNRIGGKVAGTEVVKKMGRMSRETLKVFGDRIRNLANRKFVKRLTESCGAKALQALFKKAGLKGAVGAGLFVIDGPIPIGDALGAIFLAMTAKDVYDLSHLIWEGYALNNELNERLPLEIARFEVKEPVGLIEKYGQVDQSNAELVFESILKEPEAVIRIQRDGNAGYEEWSVANGELANLTLFDMKGDRVAGMNDADLQRVAETQGLIDQV